MNGNNNHIEPTKKKQKTATRLFNNNNQYDLLQEVPVNNLSAPNVDVDLSSMFNDDNRLNTHTANKKKTKLTDEQKKRRAAQMRKYRDSRTPEARERYKKKAQEYRTNCKTRARRDGFKNNTTGGGKYSRKKTNKK